MSGKWRFLRSLPILITVLVATGLPATAGATGGSTYDPLSSGSTKISFGKPFLALLNRFHVKLAATAPTKLKAGTFSFPVSDGEYDPTIEKGSVDQDGGLVFSTGQRRVVLSDVMLKIKPAPLYAKVGGGQLKLAGNAKTRLVRDGFGARFTATGLRLTSKFATRLNKKLGLPGRPLKPGLPLAKITSTVQPASVNVLEAGRATLLPDPAIFAKLHSLHVSINPISPAELAPGPIFTLPIALKGRISPDGRSGLIKTEGSLEFLQLGAGQVFWHAFNFELGIATTLAEVDVEPTPTFPGKLGQVPITTFDLPAATITSNPKARTIAFSDAHLALSAQSAATFNQAFAEGKEVFKAAEPLGTVSFTAQGQ
jgi:hypothetical protein